MMSIAIGFANQLEDYSRSLGIDKIAFADLTIEGLLLRSENAEYLLESGYRVAISLAMRLSESTCNLVLRSDDVGLMNYFKSHALTRANQLDAAAQNMVIFLEDNGFSAFLVPGLGAGYSSDAPGIVSHMAIANVSGMGTMGDNGMILTSEFGPRVRLCTIITDCPLPIGKRIPDCCLHCGLCTEACPSGAITGERFDLKIPTKQYMDRIACGKYRDKRLEETGNRFCNLCMAVCPIGAKLYRKV